MNNAKLTLSTTEDKRDITFENNRFLVYDGDTITAPVLGRFSGNTLPSEITSGSDRMLITFESDQSGESAGWIADYRSTLPVYCSGQTTLTEPSGAFSDGSGNKRYNNNSVCKWRIQPPGAEFVTLWFTSFSTADSLDRVVITDLVTHEQLGTFSGSEIPPPVTASSGKMLVIFFTNNNATGDGWDALYTSFGVNTPENEKNGPAAYISPNPARGSAHLFFQSQNKGNASLEIITPEGKRVFSGKIDKTPGMNDVIISTENLKTGFYILILSADNNINVLKFIVN